VVGAAHHHRGFGRESGGQAGLQRSGSLLVRKVWQNRSRKLWGGCSRKWGDSISSAAKNRESKSGALSDIDRSRTALLVVPASAGPPARRRYYQCSSPTVRNTRQDPLNNFPVFATA
jgi:hypothetical protein